MTISETLATANADWFADDAFWRETFPFMFPESRVAAAATEVDQIVALTGTLEGHVLDLACGPGRHSLAFAKRGFTVTGVDRTPFLSRARPGALEEREDVHVEWIESGHAPLHPARGRSILAVSLHLLWLLSRRRETSASSKRREESTSRRRDRDGHDREKKCSRASSLRHRRTRYPADSWCSGGAWSTAEPDPERVDAHPR
jgi:SAM-dependent methyltransferase